MGNGCVCEGRAPFNCCQLVSGGLLACLFSLPLPQPHMVFLGAPQLRFLLESVGRGDMMRRTTPRLFVACVCFVVLLGLFGSRTPMQRIDEDVRFWLQLNGYASKYGKIFMERGIRWSHLPQLSEGEVRDMGVGANDAKRLVKLAAKEEATRVWDTVLCSGWLRKRGNINTVKGHLCETFFFFAFVFDNHPGMETSFLCAVGQHGASLLQVRCV